MNATSSEAGRELGVSARQVRRHAHSGRIMVDRLGSAAVVPPRQIRMLARTAHHGRPWNAETRAATLDFLTQGTTDRLQAAAKSRLKRRIRSLQVGALAGQILRGHTTLRSRVRVDESPSFVPSLMDELGLSVHGGLGVIVAPDSGRAARNARLALDPDGDIVVIDGLREHTAALEALALFAYGDTRENSAAHHWIRAAQDAL